ncbi:MAG: hypothetical protein OHK0022_49550 [Roseiflexaceae bacterium]
MSDTRKSSRAKDKEKLTELRDRKVAPMRPPPRIIDRERAMSSLDDLPVRTRSSSTRSRSSALPPARLLEDEFDEPRPMLSPLQRNTLAVHSHLYDAPLPRVSSGSAVPGAGWFSLRQPWMLALIAAASIVVLLLASTPSQTIISAFQNNLRPAEAVKAEVQTVPQLPLTPAGEHSVLGNSTITAEQIDAVLAEYGSPAAGTGAIWIEMSQKYNINAAYALAFFIHESSAGTNPGWAGIKPDGATTHNIGNIICAGYATCFGRFRDYPGWREGIQDWYRLIADEYVEWRGVHTVEQIIPIYAPSFENNVPAYVNAVTALVNSWQQGGQ